MNTKKISYSGVLIAFGILLPFIFHQAFTPPIGREVSTFLNPMHYAAFLAGGFFGPIVGLLVGFFTVFLSSTITTMPPYPLSLFMIFESATYGIVFGYLYYKKHLNIYISLIAAMVIGRIVFVFASFVIGSVLMDSTFAFVSTLISFAKGLVGAAVQIAIIPIVVSRINKAFGFNQKDKTKAIEDYESL